MMVQHQPNNRMAFGVRLKSESRRERCDASARSARVTAQMSPFSSTSCMTIKGLVSKETLMPRRYVVKGNTRICHELVDRGVYGR